MKMGIWVICTSNQLSVFTLKLNFEKNMVISDKNPFSVLCTPHFTASILASHKGVLYENMTFSIIVLSTKRQCWFFLFFIFQKTLFKVTALKTFIIFSDCHMKICQSLKQRAVLKVHIYVLPRNYVLYAGFKMEPL